MNNYLLKFKHSNGSNVWFTVFCHSSDLQSLAKRIEGRTSFLFLYDFTLLDDDEK